MWTVTGCLYGKCDDDDVHFQFLRGFFSNQQCTDDSHLDLFQKNKNN